MGCLPKTDIFGLRVVNLVNQYLLPCTLGQKGPMQHEVLLTLCGMEHALWHGPCFVAYLLLGNGVEISPLM